MTILVVDDQEQNRYLLQVLLGGNGYRVVTAGNGADALAIARNEPPDLIVSDILMPTMDGFSLCREWKKDERLRAIPFVFYTATYTEERDREFALGLGAQRFVIKPQEPDSFLQAIREALEEVQHSSADAIVPTADELEADETGYLKQYNEVLVRKLERQVEQLAQANRELAREIAEHERTEESLREAEARFRALYENNMDAILLTIPEGGILAANPACCRMFGRSENEICKRGRPALVDASDPRLAALLDERARTGKAHGELTFVRGDGTSFEGEVTSSVFLDAQGQRRTCMAIRDITERRRAEEALRVKDTRLDKLASQAPGMLYQFMRRPDGTYCVPFTSVAIRKVFGCSPEDVREDFSPIARVILPEDLGPVIASIEGSAAALAPWQCEYRVQLPGGAVRWLWGHAMPERLPDGSTLWHGFNTDVTERKRADDERRQAEEAVKRQAEFLQRMIDAMPYPIFYKDRQGRYLGCNRAFEQFYGTTRDKIAGKTVYEIAPQPLADVYAKADAELLAHPATQTYEGVVQPADGVRHDVVFHKATFAGSDGTVAGLIGAVVDITERKKAEAAIQEQLDELRRWQQATEGREGRILELKKEVNDLLAKAGQAPRYPSALAEE